MLAMSLLLALAGGPTALHPAPAPLGALLAPQPKILVFSKTAGFRHDSIPDGIKAIQDLGHKGAFAVDATEDGAAFTKENLSHYACVVFLSTTGDVLDDAQQTAFEKYVEGGGGYVGVHAASDCEYDWPWYGQMMGAWFEKHPAIQEAVIKVEDRKHPSTKMLPALWKHTDEWYNFRTNPRPHVHVLASLDESSYQGGDMNGDHPIMWCHETGKGRVWYTNLGHRKETWAEDLFLQSLQGGILWACKLDRLKGAGQALSP
jgi:cytochrome c